MNANNQGNTKIANNRILALMTPNDLKTETW